MQELSTSVVLRDDHATTVFDYKERWAYALGSQLAAVLLQTSNARRVLQADPDDADALLAQIQTELQGAVRDIRIALSSTGS